MKIGIQEIVALCIVLAVVLFAIWRRWQRGRAGRTGCSNCDQVTARPADEQTIHPFRREP